MILGFRILAEVLILRSPFKFLKGECPRVFALERQ